jgi:hypothetical protein
VQYTEEDQIQLTVIIGHKKGQSNTFSKKNNFVTLFFYYGFANTLFAVLYMSKNTFLQVLDPPYHTLWTQAGWSHPADLKTKNNLHYLQKLKFMLWLLIIKEVRLVYFCTSR